ncbi:MULTISPECIES: hypothetical protein [unclassified Mesorhizobium]
MLAALGSHNVAVYEWAQADIRKSRLPNGPAWVALAQPKPPLHFTGWQLAHAVVKADYLVERDLLLPGLGFLLQVDRIVDFSPAANLRIVPGSPASLNDFTRTSLSGRLGQGLSLLFAHGKGYNFAGHLASDLAVSSHLASLHGKTMKLADFLFETQTMQRMILESKASFSQPDNDPSKIKTVLKAALIAVYSCFREKGNSAQSALIFVDPPGRDGTGPVELPKSWVRRRNYAAWLAFMGLTDTARSLRDIQRRDRIAVDFPIFQVGARRFAMSLTISPHQKGLWIGAGLDVHALEAIGAALEDDEWPLLTYDGNTTDGGGPANPVVQNGSVFPDGSLFAAIDGTMFQGHRTFLL